MIAGNCEIGENAFLGINSTINDETKIGKDCLIASGALITKDTEEGKMYAGMPAKPLAKDSYSHFNIASPTMNNV